MNLKLAMLSLVFAAGTATAQPAGGGDATDTGGVQETPASPRPGDMEPGAGSGMEQDRSGVDRDAGDMRDAPAGDTRREDSAIERDGSPAGEESAGEDEGKKKRRWWKFWQRDRDDADKVEPDQGGASQP